MTPATDQLFLVVAHAVIARIRELRASEAPQSAQKPRLVFTEQGWRESLQEGTIRSGIPPDQILELAALPHTKSCIDALLKEGTLRPPAMSDSSGNPIPTPTYEQYAPILTAQLAGVVEAAVNEKGSPDVSDDDLLRTFSEYMSACISSSVRWKVTVPLLNFSAVPQAMKLGCLEIVPLTPDDKTEFWAAGYMLTQYITPTELSLCEFKLTGFFEGDPATQYLKERAVEDIGNAITSIRLLKSGNVGAGVMFCQREQRVMQGLTAYWPPLPDFGVSLGSGFDLLESDLPSLLDVFRLVDRVAHGGPPGVLRLALRRFNQAYGRSCNEDRIIDFVIALESCLLPGKTEELKLRLALRGAALLADEHDPHRTRMLLEAIYDARSQIVHSGKPLTKIKLTKLSRIGVNQADLPQQCEEITRVVLKKCLHALANGQSLQDISNAAERQLMTGLSCPRERQVT